VLIFHSDEARANEIAAQFSMRRMVATVCDDPAMAIAILYTDPPDLIVIHQDVEPGGGLALATTLKSDNVFAHLPILFLVHRAEAKALLAQDDYPFDDYVDDAAPQEDMMARGTLCILRAHRQLDANPLTRLPGNNSIIKELERRLERKEEFAVVYVDLDHFKAFNDRYGFTRGDEALKLSARLMVNCVSSGSPKDYYVGHVGGDDFIFIIPGDRAEAVCEQFVANFDGIIGSLYDDEDRRQGFIQSKNRQGQDETFPIMSVSLAVAVNRNAHFQHPGQISAVAAEIKKVLKKNPRSGFMIDRRDYTKPPPYARIDTPAATDGPQSPAEEK